MSKKKSLLTLSIIFTAFILCSCSPAIKISISENNEIDYSFSATIADSITDIAKSFSDLPEDSSLFDSSKIQETLQSTGLNSVAVKQPDNNSIEVSGSFSKETEDLTQQILQDAISVTSSEMKLNLSANVIQRILETIPPETAEYVELLSAPILTGEIMTPEEYSELMAAVYGEKASNALNTSKVFITVNTEKPITNVSASISECSTETDHTKVIFSFPLVNFLTFSEEIVFCVQF